MNSADPSILLSHHLKALKLPVFLREYAKVAARCAKENKDTPRFLMELCELELLEREKKSAQRRIVEAGFPVIKTLDSYDFLALPGLNKLLVTELSRGEYIGRRENVLAVGNSGTGKTHIATALGLCACHQGKRVKFYTAAGLVTSLLEARDERALGRFEEEKMTCNRLNPLLKSPSIGNRPTMRNWNLMPIITLWELPLKDWRLRGRRFSPPDPIIPGNLLN